MVVSDVDHPFGGAPVALNESAVWGLGAKGRSPARSALEKRRRGACEERHHEETLYQDAARRRTGRPVKGTAGLRSVEGTGSPIAGRRVRG